MSKKKPTLAELDALWDSTASGRDFDRLPIARRFAARKAGRKAGVARPRGTARRDALDDATLKIGAAAGIAAVGSILYGLLKRRKRP